jgi:spermidine/putrescine transport system permease protein
LIRTFAMQQVIRNEGLVNTALIWLGIIERPLQIMHTDVGDPARHGLRLPAADGAAALCLDGEARLPPGRGRLRSLRDRLQVLWRIIIPLVKPGIIAGSILVFIPSLGAYVIPRILGGGKNMMLGNLIELQFGSGRNWPLGAAISITLMAMVMVALLVYVRNATRSGAGHG